MCTLPFTLPPSLSLSLTHTPYYIHPSTLPSIHSHALCPCPPSRTTRISPSLIYAPYTCTCHLHDHIPRTYIRTYYYIHTTFIHSSNSMHPVPSPIHTHTLPPSLTPPLSPQSPLSVGAHFVGARASRSRLSPPPPSGCCSPKGRPALFPSKLTGRRHSRLPSHSRRPSVVHAACIVNGIWQSLALRPVAAAVPSISISPESSSTLQRQHLSCSRSGEPPLPPSFLRLQQDPKSLWESIASRG